LRYLRIINISNIVRIKYGIYSEMIQQLHCAKLPEQFHRCLHLHLQQQRRRRRQWCTGRQDVDKWTRENNIG